MRHYLSKTLALVLVVAMILSVTPITLVSAAPTDVQFTIGTVTVTKGSTDVITVPVDISKLPADFNLGSFGWEFEFDSTKLTFQKDDAYTAFAGSLVTDPGKDVNQGKVESNNGTKGMFRWGFSTTENYIKATGNVVNLKFKLADGLAAGTYPITAKCYGDINNGTSAYVTQTDIEAALETYMVAGAIVVEEPPVETDFVFQVGNVTAAKGATTVDVPLTIEKFYADETIGGFSVNVKYDTAKLTYKSISFGDMIPKKADMDYSEPEAGTIFIGFSTAADPITSAGIAANKLFATITFDVKDTGTFKTDLAVEAASKMTNSEIPAVTLVSKKNLADCLKAGSVEIKDAAPVVTLESIAVSGVKTAYNVGDEFVKPTVTATYSDESTKDVTAEATFAGFDSATAGTKTITVTFEGKTATFDVTVTAPVVTLESIAVAADAKKEYTVGEDFVKPVVTATYSDGSTKAVEATFAGYDLATAGTYTVTATFEGKTATYEITVTAPVVTLESIAVAADAKKDYAYGDEFVKPVVTATYSDETTKDVTAEATFAGFDANKPGKQTITVTFEDKTATYEVTVAEPAKVVKEIYVDVEGAKVTYKTDDTFVAPTVVAKYTDAYYADEVVEGATFAGYDMTATDGAEQTVTVTYVNADGTFTTTYKITVADDAVTVADLVIETPVVNEEGYLEVPAGTTLEDIIKVIATMSDETTEEIEDGYSIAGYDKDAEGKQTVRIAYQGLFVDIKVDVLPKAEKKVTGIAVDLDQTITAYYKGDLYRFGDAVITVTYDDGSTADVDVDESMITGFKTSSVGPKIVTVTYEGFTATYTMNVSVQGGGGIGGGGSGVAHNFKPIVIIGEDEEETGLDRVLKFAIGSTKYELDNKAYYTDTPFYLKNDRTMVPVRFIAETLGYTVEWNEATQTVTIKNDTTTIVLTIGSTTMYINGKAKIMDVAPEISDSRTCVPVRFVAEAFGGIVGWEDATQMVTITFED